MKYIVLLGDGMADFPLDPLAGRTPLEAAATPAMDEVATLGLSGLFCPIPDGLPPGSDIGNLSLFGYNPRVCFTGRAPLEAARQGILLTAHDVAFRCNLVTLEDGVMKSFTAGHISTEEASLIIADLNASLSELGAVFHTGVSYRHLSILSDRVAPVDRLAAIACEPPHNITDKRYESYLPRGEGADVVIDLMERSKPLLAKHPINTARIAAGKPPATSIWLWGQGRSPRLESFRALYNRTGAVVSAVDLVNGIGVCAGLDVLAVPGATGYLDTNYEGKVSAALKALDTHDFVYVHIEAPDETSHEGRTDLKMQAIEDFDRRVVRPCLDFAKKRGDCRLLVAPDHITAISTKTHASGPVPFALYGPGVAVDASTAYNESAAAKTGVLVSEGHRLVPCMLTADAISPDSLRALP